MTEVFLRFFQHAADSFLLGDVVVEFLNVTFGLFGAFVFALSTTAFGFFSVASRSFHFAHVTVVTKVDDDDDRNADQQRPYARRAHAADDESSACRAGKITDRDPQEVARPH